MKIIDDTNFTIQDYKDALGYLRYLSKENPEMFQDCMEDIDTIENILEEAEFEKIDNAHNKRNKQQRKRREYYKKKKLYENTKNSWGAPIYKHEDGSLRRCSWGENRKRFYKKHSNRLNRRSSNKMLRTLGTYGCRKGNHYRRVFDYAWEID